MQYRIIQLMKAIPAPIKRLAIQFIDKHKAELMFQKGWAKEFAANKPTVLEYWKKYRYLEEIKQICNIKRESKVLDVGCGISTVLHFVEGERYGIDPIADEYKKLYAYPKGINIQKNAGESIPFSDNYFDVVFCTNVIDHVIQPLKTINEIHRVLKPGGYFVLTVELFEEKAKRDPAHPHCFIKNDIYSLVSKKFKMVFEKQSTWIGLRPYVNGSRKGHNKELIVILVKE